MTLFDRHELAELVDASYVFRRQAYPVSADLRPERRIPLLLFLLDKGYGAGASWQGLHVLNWMSRDRDHADLLVAIREGRDIPNVPVVRFEPALDKALDLAIGLGFVTMTHSGTFKLTQQGRGLVDEIRPGEVFQRERAALALVSGKVSQGEVERLLRRRTP